MPTVIRIEPHMYLHTPLGPAEAHFLWVADNYESPVAYGCFQSETKENWWWPNTQVRLTESITDGRSEGHTDIFVNDALFETLRPHILRHKSSPLYGRASREDL